MAENNWEKVKQILEEEYAKQVDVSIAIEEIIQEVRKLRREVASAWLHRQYEKPYLQAKKAKDKFIDMPIGLTDGQHSFEILRQLYKKAK